MFRPFSERWVSRGRGEVDPLSLIIIYFYTPELTPRLLLTETTLQFSDNKTFLAISRIQTGVGKEG
jgi:hypothetical protein